MMFINKINIRIVSKSWALSSPKSRSWAWAWAWNKPMSSHSSFSWSWDMSMCWSGSWTNFLVWAK